MPGLNQSGEVLTIPPYILPASPAGGWECVVNWPVVFQCGEVGFVTVQRRCRLTYLFPAGATPRLAAEPAIARSVTTPAGATRSDRRRRRRGRRHGVYPVFAGRGVGPDMGGATTALLHWPETRCGAGGRADPPCVARRRAAPP